MPAEEVVQLLPIDIDEASARTALEVLLTTGLIARRPTPQTRGTDYEQLGYYTDILDFSIGGHSIEHELAPQYCAAVESLLRIADS